MKSYPLIGKIATLLLAGSLHAQASENHFKIVQPSFCHPSKYERILMTQLRDKNTSTEKFREAANRLSELLVHRIVECLPTKEVQIETPVNSFKGECLSGKIEFVSIMRSGDALLDTFSKHFPEAIINKILVQRDEETAEPLFKYMRLSSTISTCDTVIITEPMIATGGTLSYVIALLKERGVHEENIVVASVLSAPEGLKKLSTLFPSIKVITVVIDDCLNDRKFISPGLGDFGDRYFGT